jgi:hypothetical protein
MNKVPNANHVEWASLFGVTGDANVNYAVSQIDVVVVDNNSVVNSFTVFLAVDNNGVPGAVVPNSTMSFKATAVCCASLDTIVIRTSS